jgi:hypothetical protein
VSTPLAGAEPVPRSPYVGLASYGETEQRLFFGRDHERRLLVHAVRAAKLTLVYGPGGVGKSSLLLAGVVPELRALGEQRRNAAGDPDLVPVVFRSWHDGPQELRRVVARALGDEPAAWDDSLADIVEEATALAETRVVIVLDQLEQYFTYRALQDVDFIGDLVGCLARPRLRASFLLSIREDALGQLDELVGRIPQIFENATRVQDLSREAARAAIVGPLESVGATIDADLVEAIIDESATGRLSLTSSGLGPMIDHTETEVRVQPVSLQLVMTRLWAEASRAGSLQLRREQLEQLGGAERIVGTYVDGELVAFSGDDSDVVAALLRFLVTPSGASIALTTADLAVYVARPVADVERILDLLADRRIVRAVAPSGVVPEPRYEIFHDSLAPAVLEWLRRAEFSAERDRQRRRLLRVLSITFVLLLLALVLALVVYSSVRAR